MPLIILNFHGVGPVTREIDAGEHDCWLDQDHFETVLDLVRDRPNIRLTVDDGNASDFELILPALLRRGLKAMFFVCAGLLDQPTFLSRRQVKELQARGMTIGSHGARHRSWRRLTASQASEEFENSRAEIEKVCEVPVDTAACPFGAYDRTVLVGLRRAGYRTVYTSDGGVARESDWLRARTSVTRSTPLAETRHLIEQGPNAWQQLSIDLRKFIKRMRS